VIGPRTIEEQAERLYEAMANKVKPKWEQLTPGGACQSVWIEYARKIMPPQAPETHE